MFSFYLDAKNQTSLKEHGFSTQWAELAGKLAFQEVESPNEDNIVAFVNLGLFWYSQGSWRRSYIHKGIDPKHVFFGSRYFTNHFNGLQAMLCSWHISWDLDSKNLTRRVPWNQRSSAVASGRVIL